jgi:hypothetical protein
MNSDLKRASELVAKLEELSKQNRSSGSVRSGDEVATEQLAVFGELLVVLARGMDRAQNAIKWLTVVITVLTGVLVVEALARWFQH